MSGMKQFKQMLSDPLLILGAGGHTKVLIDTILQNGGCIIGIVDPDESKKGQSILGIKVIGDDNEVFAYDPEKVLLVNGVGSVGCLNLRRDVFERFKKSGYSFATVIHKSAIVSPSVTLGEGVQIMAGAVIQSDVYIGSNSIINTRAAVDHDCYVGEHVHVSPGVTLSGGVKIENGVHIGTGASIIQNVCIGKNVIVGAGAVVLRDFGENLTVVGVPARKV